MNRLRVRGIPWSEEAYADTLIEVSFQLAVLQTLTAKKDS